VDTEATGQPEIHNPEQTAARAEQARFQLFAVGPQGQIPITNLDNPAYARSRIEATIQAELDHLRAKKEAGYIAAQTPTTTGEAEKRVSAGLTASQDLNLPIAQHENALAVTQGKRGPDTDPKRPSPEQTINDAHRTLHLDTAFGFIGHENDVIDAIAKLRSTTEVPQSLAATMEAMMTKGCEDATRRYFLKQARLSLGRQALDGLRGVALRALESISSLIGRPRQFVYSEVDYRYARDQANKDYGAELAQVADVGNFVAENAKKWTTEALEERKSVMPPSSQPQPA